MSERRLDGARAGAFQGLREARDGHSQPIIEHAQSTLPDSHDRVTGLADRSLFHHLLAQQMTARSQCGFAVLVIGLDDFRSVGESLGHRAADDLAKAVAHSLRATVSATATLGRLTDTEFAVMLADVASPGDAQEVTESLQDLLRSPTTCAGVEITARVSIGVRHCAAGVDVDVDVEEVLSDAGAAMDTATKNSCRVAVFETSMRTSRLRRLQLTEALEHALDRGEISVHYQPYFSFTDAHACGVEALARWHHPTYGEVDPSEFIMLAESTGKIAALGLFVLTQACHDIALLRRQHPEHSDLTLSVNLSARQLVDGRFQQELRAVLEKTGLPAHALMLELTETAFVDDVDGVVERLFVIRGMGVHLAVDDFGTHYASLSYLQRFPVDTLKVDHTFVQRVHESPYNHLLTGAIITMAKTLGLRTIAEGIEEDEHARRLSLLGCDAGQGFLLARPVPVASLPAALRSRMTADAERAAQPGQPRFTLGLS